MDLELISSFVCGFQALKNERAELLGVGSESPGTRRLVRAIVGC